MLMRHWQARLVGPAMVALARDDPSSGAGEIVSEILGMARRHSWDDVAALVARALNAERAPKGPSAGPTDVEA